MRPRESGPKRVDASPSSLEGGYSPKGMAILAVGAPRRAGHRKPAVGARSARRNRTGPRQRVGRNVTGG
jgi:hypothetical protein